MWIYFLIIIIFKWFPIQPKIQDELIAREIIINDAESSIRYKLTKRQTQEEVNLIISGFHHEYN